MIMAPMKEQVQMRTVHLPEIHIPHEVLTVAPLMMSVTALMVSMMALFLVLLRRYDWWRFFNEPSEDVIDGVFDDEDEIYEMNDDVIDLEASMDLDAMIVGRDSDGDLAVIEDKWGDDPDDSESLRAELEAISGDVEELQVPENGQFPGEVLVGLVIVALTAGSLGLFVLMSGGTDHTVTMSAKGTSAEVEGINADNGSSFIEELKTVAEFTNGIAGER